MNKFRIVGISFALFFSDMARNEWINGYLEAILDAGAHKLEEKNEIGTHFKFSPTKYFVEEVVNSFDESDLHRTWVKVTTTILFFFSSSFQGVKGKRGKVKEVSLSIQTCSDGGTFFFIFFYLHGEPTFYS